MLYNYFKIAIRNILKNKITNGINILGLAVGIASCLIIFLYISFELSYDKFHPNYERIYRVYASEPNSSSGSEITAGPLMDLIIENVPEAESACRWSSTLGSVSLGEHVFDEGRILFTDQSFFDVFGFESLERLPNNVLNDPSNILITENMAEKYFGKDQPIGKILKVRIDGEEYDCKVSAILKNTPENSHISFNYILSYQLSKKVWNSRSLTSWNYRDFFSYVKLKKGTDPVVAEEKINSFYKRSHDDVSDEIKMQSISDIHLYGNIGGDNQTRDIYLFSSIALLILFIACFNYINLTTARCFGRFKEIGVRKVIGANKIMLTKQFLFESIFITIIALVLSIILTEFFLPSVNLFLDKELSIQNELLTFILFLIFIIFFVGIIAGSYPAFVISKYKPVDAIKNLTVSGSKASVLLRNILLVIQFFITISLIIGSLVINKQMKYIKNKDLGYNPDKVMYVRLSENKSIGELKLFSQELKKITGVEDLSFTKFLPSSIRSRWSFTGFADTVPSKGSMYINKIDENFLNFYDIKLIKGRELSDKSESDLTGACIVNQSAVSEYNWENVNDNIYIDFGDGKIKVVGIIKDFHFASLYRPISPLAMILSSTHRMISIKINSGDYGNTVKQIEESFMEFFPDQSFKYRFLTDSIDASYAEESKKAELINVFTFLSIIIVCLGLYGLLTFYSENKKKEFTIRKILGASVSQIIRMVSWHFMIYILIATAISWPLIFYFMSGWLENFAFRIRMPYELFIISTLITIIITFLTIYGQLIKALRINLVESLKYE